MGLLPCLLVICCLSLLPQVSSQDNNYIFIVSDSGVDAEGHTQQIAKAFENVGQQPNIEIRLAYPPGNETWTAEQLEDEVDSYVSNIMTTTTPSTAVVFGMGPVFAEAIGPLVAKWPDVKIVHLKTTGEPISVDHSYANVHSIRYRVEEASFVHGVIVGFGMKEKNGFKVAYYGRKGEGVYLQGFLQGIHYVEPKASITLRIFNDTTYNYDAIHKQATADLDDSFSVLYTVLGRYNQAMYTAIHEASFLEGQAVYVLGDASNSLPLNKTIESGILSTAMIDPGKMIADLIPKVVSKQTLPDEVGISDGYLNTLWFTPGYNYTTDVEAMQKRKCGNETLLEKLTAIRQQVLDGSIKVSPHECHGLQCPGKGVPHRCIEHSRNLRYRKVGIGLYVNHIGSIDVKAGTFYGDFDLYMYEANQRYETRADVIDSFTASDECDMKRGDFTHLPISPETEMDFVNIESVRKIDIISKTPETPANVSSKTETSSTTATEFLKQLVALPKGTQGAETEKTEPPKEVLDHYKVKGVFYFKTSLSAWPAGVMNMMFLIQRKKKVGEFETFCHMPRYSGISPQISLPGLKGTEGISYEHDVVDVCGPPFLYPTRSLCLNNDKKQCECATKLETADEPVRFPQYSDVTCRCMGGSTLSKWFSFSINFDRPSYGVMLIFLPPIFILLVNQASFIMSYTHATTKISVCATALTSSVMFHVTIANKVPDSNSTTTRADRFMILLYFLNFLSWINAIIQLAFYQAGKEDYAKLIFKSSRIGGPLVSFLCLLALSISDQAWTVTAIGAMGILATSVLAVFPALKILRLKSKKLREKTKSELDLESAIGALSPPSSSDGAAQPRQRVGRGQLIELTQIGGAVDDEWSQDSGAKDTEATPLTGTPDTPVMVRKDKTG